MREVGGGGEGFAFDLEGDVPRERCSFFDT